MPGTYSLTAYSIEEVIARDYIVEEHPDLVVMIVDAANIERNLYLAVQILEMGISGILVLNMSDVAESRGIWIDADQLSAALGVPVVATIASKERGINDLKEAILAILKTKEERQ